jgi:hypothetical protein
MASNGTAPTGDLLTVASGVARLNYFFGQLLTQRDLHAEQRYHLELRRLMQREAFGMGTVAGLRVEDAGATTQGGVFVRAGLAMDPEGRELLLINDQCVKVAAAPATASTAAAYVTHDDPAGMATDISAAWGAAIDHADLVSKDDPGSLWNHLKAAGLTEIDTDPTPGTKSYPALRAQLNQLAVPKGFQLKHGQLLRDVLFDALVGTTYLGLQYAERGTEPSATVLDASCCGNATCFPSRREEGVAIVAYDHPFHPLPDAYRDALEKFSDDLVQEENPATPRCGPADHRLCEEALCEIVMEGWRGLPPDDPCHTPDLPVVPLARVYWSRFPRNPPGQSRVLSVDNACRPLAPGVPPVRAILAALTQCTPVKPTSPRFDRISPHDHAQIAADATNEGLTITARATSLLVTPIPPTSWEIYFYPSSSPFKAAHWNSARTPAADGYKLTIKLHAQTVPSATSPRATEVHIVLAPDPGQALPAGTYRWRLNRDATNPIQALQTRADVEGILEAVFYVP